MIFLERRKYLKTIILLAIELKILPCSLLKSNTFWFSKIGTHPLIDGIIFHWEGVKERLRNTAMARSFCWQDAAAKITCARIFHKVQQDTFWLW